MAGPIDENVERIGSVNLKYGEKIIHDIQIYKVVTDWGDNKDVYFTTQPIDELGISAKKIQLKTKLNGMSSDFETVIKPLFEGEEVEQELISDRTGKPYKAILTFDPTVPGFSRGKKAAFNQGRLNLGFVQGAGPQHPMQSVGHADVLYGNEKYENVEIFKVTPEGKSPFYSFEIPGRAMNKTRMYIGGRYRGMREDFEGFIKPLLEGKKPSSTWKSKDGREFESTFEFDFDAVPSFVEDPNKTPYYGSVEMVEFV